MDKSHYKFVSMTNSIVKKRSGRVLFRLLKNNGKDVTFRYDQIPSSISRIKQKLNNAGIGTGCRVAVISEHSPYALLTDLLLAYIGIKSVLIDAGLPVDDVKKMIADADVSGLILSHDKLNTFFSSETFETPAFVMEPDFSYSHIPSSPEKCVRNYPHSDDDVIAIIYSSGTTGVNKGVEVTYRSILLTTKWCHDYDIVLNGTRHLNVIPANHIAGFSTGTACILLGSEMGFIEEVSSAALLSAMQRFNPRNFIMVPKVYEVMMDKIKGEIAKKPLPVRAYAKFAIGTCSVVRRKTGIKLRFLTKPIWKQAFGTSMLIVGSGTAPCKKEIAEFYLDLGMNFMDVYGSTECGVPISSTNVFEKYPVSGTGKVFELPYVKIRIANPDSEGVGEIRIKTKMIMKGYFKDEALTKAAFDKNGWFCTGDLGYVDKEKNLHIIGRIKESIVLRNGKKVSPADVDDFYKTLCPDINIASCGIPDQDGFDSIELFVESAGHQEKEIAEAVKSIKKTSDKQNIYRRLNAVHIVEKLPTTSIGKVKRYLLKGMRNTSSVPIKTQPESAPAVEIIKLLRKYVPESETITRGMSLREDLNIDSLSMFELSSDIQSNFGVDISAAMTNQLTVEELEGLIHSDGAESYSTNYDINDYPANKSPKDIDHLIKFAKFSDHTWNIKCFGLENIPKNGKYILCPNHESHLDTMWIVSALYLNGINIINKCGCMGAEYVMFDKVLGKGFRALGGIPVDRTGNPTPALKRAESWINENNECVFMIHPEGTRTRDGKLGEFKKGAAALAIDTDTVIIPVCINGAREIFPPDKKLPNIIGKKPLEIHFGSPILPNDRSADDITNEIKAYIQQHKNRWYHNAK